MVVGPASQLQLSTGLTVQYGDERSVMSNSFEFGESSFNERKSQRTKKPTLISSRSVAHSALEAMKAAAGALRKRLRQVARADVRACSAAQSDHEQCPLVACGRHKSRAVLAELDLLAGNEEAALLQLERTRDAAVAAGHPADEVERLFDCRVAEVRDAAASKRAALEKEATLVDDVLEKAAAAVEALHEVRRDTRRIRIVPTTRILYHKHRPPGGSTTRN